MSTRASSSVITPDTSGISECFDRLAAAKHHNRPLSTYRVQFHASFRFEHALRLVPYLHSLGITHLYSSPILQARAGSLHGYDIINHNEINPEVGTEAEFEALVDELRRHGMGLILDIVPNHMGVGYGTNPWWQDVLENGRASEFAGYFDIDWEPVKTELRNKVLIPVLGDMYGEELERGHLKLEFTGTGFRVTYYDKVLPIDPQTYPLIFEPIGDLRQRLPEADDEEPRAELESILWELRQLPLNSTSDPDQIRRRQREFPGLKERLKVLVENSPRIRAVIDEAVRLCNGPPGDARSFDTLHRLLEAQAYRLAHWRVSAHEINYRRFFDINELIGVRMENPRVFADTHKLIRRLLADGSIAGLRLDHPDGLLNPVQYFTRVQMLYAASQCSGAEPRGTTGDNGIELDIQQVFGQHDWMNQQAPLYVLVEKILEHGEHLPSDWPVDGTVGYEFANLVNGLFIDTRNRRTFTTIYRRFTGNVATVDDMTYDAKQLIMRTALASEVTVLSHKLEEIASTDRRARDFTRSSLTEAIRETIACFPVYRTYIDERGTLTGRDRDYINVAIMRAKRRNPGTNTALFDFLRSILLLEQRDPTAEQHRLRLFFALKFQQLTGPVMAKGLEDTVCYRYNRLASVNEVGGSPDQFGVTLEEFHAANEERLREWPYSMLAGSTHDTKRSEDVRARINVLSEMPREWAANVLRWRRINRSKKRAIGDGRLVPDANEEYLLYQTLLGAWPLRMQTGEQREQFAARIKQYMNKAVHEGKVNLSWVNDNPEYIIALEAFIDRILRSGTGTRPNAFLEDMQKLVHKIALFGAMNSVAQTLLKLTCPGVPDTYQGTEVFDLSLVDPDNRRPVDYDMRRRIMDELDHHSSHNGKPVALCDELVRDHADGRIKLWTTHRALCFRREHPQLFQTGEYHSLTAQGEHQGHVVAFTREHRRALCVVAVPRLAYTLARGEERPPLGDLWGDTSLSLPRASSEFLNIFTGEVLTTSASRSLACREIFGHFPAALLLAT
jgi:(1->4)-alpha-D-glucan 1-alpha-D-glucosylmutase